LITIIQIGAMDFELGMASKRFEKENERRKQAEKRRQEKLRRERELADQKVKEFEAAAAAERKRAAEEAERLRARHDALLEKNKGVWSSQRLQVRLDTSAEAKGIRRRSDKVSLPRSFGEFLTPQHNAAAHGPMFFEVACNDRVTHASLLAFDAPEGTVGVPAKLLRSLGLDPQLFAADAPLGAPVEARVTYRLLKPGSYAKLQPVSSGFQRDVGNIKAALEQELETYGTLSEGDVILVKSIEDGSEHEVRVVSLMPEAAVSIIDTDLEVDIAPSVEAEAAQRADEERRRREREEAARMEAERAAREAVAEEDAERRRQEAAARRELAVAQLEPEPAESPTTVSIMIKLPSGARRMRRFDRASSTARLFAFVDTLDLGVDDLADASYTLSSQFPRRVVERPPAGGPAPTLEEAGLAASRHEALFVEFPRREAAVDA